MTAFAAARPLTPIVERTTPCKICATASPLFDVVDYHEDCYESDGRRMTLSGIPIYYYRCPGCGFLFTRAFDDWGLTDMTSPATTLEKVAPTLDVAERHNHNFVPLLKEWFGDGLSALRLLDLGEDKLAASLRQSGIPADRPEPGPARLRTASPLTAGPYDVILAFNIFEQLTEPLAFMKQIDQVTAPDGLLLVATPLSDGVDPAAAGIRRRPLRYISPRREQYSIFNAASLALAFGSAGFRLAGFRQGIHIGLRSLPAFAERLFEERAGWFSSSSLSGSR
ncbi:methyltransferase domain-containing protein [Hypericibacter sp.]|uniref:methyltransferase domain-containing protein n=1 Tax=Hypericibacter sp. TaxID=2705401 RepID=UPI003D6D88DA